MEKIPDAVKFPNGPVPPLPGLEGKADRLTQLYRIRNENLKLDFNMFQPLYMDIRDFLAPRTARFQGELVNNGNRQDYKIINTSPRLAVRVLPAGLQAGVTNPMRPWFLLAAPDPQINDIQSVKEWLWIVATLIQEAFAKSNLYDRLKSNYATLGTYGTSALYMDEDEDDIFRFYDIPLGAFRVGMGATQKVNSMYRDVWMSVLQIVQKFKDRTPIQIRNQYDVGNYEYKYPLIHIIEPNRINDPNSNISQFKKYASVWYDPSQTGDPAILRYSGYDYLPILCPRWDVISEDTYGVGCGEYAIGDSKQLQLLEKRGLQILDQKARPTMVGDASLRGQRTTQLPGDTTYVNGLINGNQGYKPAYEIQNPYLDQVESKARIVESRIEEAFYKNLFMAVIDIADTPNITATQINTIRDEKLMMLGPVLERLNDELLGPLIDGAFSIMYKRGLLPPPPKEIQGMPLKVEYVSILAQSQKAMGLGAIERFIGFVGQLAQQGGPSVWNKVDLNETVDAYADGAGIAPKLLIPSDQAIKMTAQQQANAQAQATAETAKTGAQAAQAAGNVDLSQDNPVSRMLGSSNAPAS